ncbi:permease prefix domain 1-containing protein, partial [Asanoa sp. NPDC050611]|uniref:permease prefix domain 1-containing protein n=1 Tax=Asanoa sp. NPDC050611 TaxID=3157098 RepID=UPI0034095F7A
MSSLTDRYLAATLGAVPAARRDEIATELRGSIEDMIDGKQAAGADATAAEREVLTELGDPAALAASYANRRLQLIGPTYYLVWERLLKLLLAFVPATVGIVVGLIAAIDGDGGDAVGKGIGTAIEVAVHVAFWTTLGFAVLERTNTRLNLPQWSVDQLREDRALGERQIGLADCVASVAFLALAIAYLPLQHFHSWVTDADGGNLPIIDPALWSFWLPFLIAVLVADVVVEIVKYRVGGWNWPLVAVNAVLSAAFAVPVIWLLQTDRLFNADFVARFEWLSKPDNLDTVATVSVVVTVVVT